MTIDALSAALDLMDARCVISGGFSTSGQWSLRSRPTSRLKLVAAVSGECWLRVDEQSAVRLGAGDVAVVVDGAAVTLSSDLEREPTETATLYGPDRNRFLQLTPLAQVEIIGGHVELGELGEGILLSGLPPVSVVRADDHASLALLLRQLTREMLASRAGNDFAMRQYSQLLFLEVVRATIEQAQNAGTDAGPGWLLAIGDPLLAPALEQLHASPGRHWTLAELAEIAHSSRTTFSTRFTAVVGLPPMAYLTLWRMQVAARMLRRGNPSVSELAGALGFASNSAFSTAFKRTVGVSPAHYRQAQLGGAAVPD